MKITLYELLGLVKDGKAPKNIKFGDIKYTLYIDEDTKQKYYQDDECRYFFLSIKCLDDLNDKVEILEEQKKIPKKIEYYDDSIAWVIDDVGQISDVDKVIIDKLNDVIDCLESKGDE